jgi:hypothetical protein
MKSLALVTSLSLIANVGLGLYLAARSPANTQVQKESFSVKKALSQPTRKTPQATLKDAPEKNSEPEQAFEWSMVESPDFTIFAANLRKHGFPESLVRDLVVSRVRNLYLEKSKDLITQIQPAYWKKYNNPQVSPALIAKLQELEKEQNEILFKALGEKVQMQESIDAYLLQNYRYNRLSGFSIETQERIEQAIKNAGINEFTPAPGKDYHAWKKDVFQKKLEAVRPILSDEEFALYKTNQSPAWDQIQGLEYFNPSEQEAMAVLKVYEEKTSPNGFRLPNRESIIEALGEERGKEYLKSSDVAFIWARKAVEKYNAPPELADQIYSLKQSSQTQADVIRADKNLSPEARTEKLKILAAQTRKQLDQLAGEKVSWAVRRGDGAWLPLLAAPNVSR